MRPEAPSAFDTPAVLAMQHEKEVEALEQIFSMLPEQDHEQMKALWLEFEEAISADACFAKAIERAAPLFLNMHNDGGSWRVHDVRKDQLLKRNQHLQRIAPKIWHYVKEQIDIAVANGWVKS
ncbi:MAG: HD domain-containing protein [Francisellaceae bacterium]